MERTWIGEAELEYEVTGSGEPVVFIHGAFIADPFRPLVAGPVLAGRYRLIRYHRRGYAGSSRVSGPLSVMQHSADCQGLLCNLGVERAHIVGHSYGGAIALQLALDFPGLAHSLALLEPAIMVGASAQGYRDALTRSRAQYRSAGAVVAVDDFLQVRSPGYRDRLDRMLPEAFDQAVADAETMFEYELPNLPDWGFGDVEAQRIGQPILSVLGGESDALWPRFGEVHRLMLEWILHAEGFVLPGTTHFMQLDDPRGVANVLESFWKRHPMSDRKP